MKFRNAHASDFLFRPVGLGPVLIALALSLLPLALTPAIPSIDFYGHVLRYDILATGGSSRAIDDSYDVAWSLLPNIGLDIIGMILLKFMSPIAGGKLIAVVIAIAPFAGILALARAIHGRIHLHQLLIAAMLMYSHIYIWGFSNFLFGFGLGLGALALWIKLADRPRLQLGAIVAIAPFLLLVHALAFAVFGILLALVELGSALQTRDVAPSALVRRTIRLAAVAALPIAIFAMSGTSQAKEGVTGSLDRLSQYSDSGALWPRLWVEIVSRVDVIVRVADSLFVNADRFLGVLLWAGLALALVRGALLLDRRLVFAAIGTLLLVAIIPPTLFGVGYVSDRMPLVLLAVLAAGTVPGPTTAALRPLLLGLVVLFMGRLMLVAAGHAQAGMVYQDFLVRVEGLDTGQTSIMLRGDGAGRAGLLPLCGPLLPLLAFQNGTAAPTWAIGSQQPIVQLGPMAEAMAELSRMGGGARNGMGKDIAALHTAGFDTVLYCTSDPKFIAPPGVQSIASGPGWFLFRR